ncbi:glucose-1-phosphate cytidylyltransferase [Lacrimispora sp. NSJ-141]|uniref:Glucose-1-phosphate cytidylyltransferase n=1 Tax=Lientehia hominis TaxID=2897778 RepID=A0AAP2RHE9_9FIRM|nr:glucose-1-phosphate cytidylyltransferase [Lientehia hominis]MCD2492284.1 glucose-1-phosphate cytidylyltransferase [Lientehia hominis]
MKVVLLAGGYGTRISEESQFKPKPMVEIGEMPILWHIMKRYSYFGFYEFIICAGYKQHVIKEWFADYFLHTSDVTFDFTKDDKMIVHNKHAEPWKVTVVDTGLNTMTGGRLKRVKQFIGNDTFFMTYGDGVSDVNISDTLIYHKKHQRMATMMAVRPDCRYGNIDLNGDQVLSFREKSQADAGWINGGFMVLEPDVLNYIDDDSTMFEREPMEKLAANRELMCYKHGGFWQCMDTLRDKQKLDALWSAGQAPWRCWTD